MKYIYYFFITLLFFTSCNSDSNNVVSPTNADAGVGGSYARFITVGNFMYIVSDTNIKTFDITAPDNPTLANDQVVGDRIESIFNFKDRLFIGSSGGLFIYQIMENGLPTKVSETTYFQFDIYPCDPVVANDSLAFVTLNSQSRINNPCEGNFPINVDVLKVFDITNVERPVLIAEYPFTAPKGVGLDGTTLFICDDTEGLKVFDVTNPIDIIPLAHIDNFTAYDVIPLDGLLLVVGLDNVYQFDYTDLNNITLISTIPYGV